MHPGHVITAQEDAVARGHAGGVAPPVPRLVALLAPARDEPVTQRRVVDVDVGLRHRGEREVELVVHQPRDGVDQLGIARARAERRRRLAGELDVVFPIRAGGARAGDGEQQRQQQERRDATPGTVLHPWVWRRSSPGPRPRTCARKSSMNCWYEMGNTLFQRSRKSATVANPRRNSTTVVLPYRSVSRSTARDACSYVAAWPRLRGDCCHRSGLAS